MGGLLETILRDPDPGRLFAETPEGARTTYGDLLAGSARFAAALAGLGVRPGDRVAAQVEKSLETILLFLGTVRAGGVYLPLNGAYTPAEVEYFLADAEPRVLVRDPGAELEPVAARTGVAQVETLDATGGGSLAERAGAEPPHFEDVSRDGGDLAAILYTSGTTGRSKGAMLTHANLASNAATLAELWRFTEEDVLLHVLPLYHVHGLFTAVHTVLAAGASLLFLPRFDAAEVVRLLPRATVLMGVPTHYTRLLAEPSLDREAAAGMRLFVSGSAPLPAEVQRAFERATGHRILERYGMTETGMNTSNPYDGERRPGSVGLPLPGVELRVVDPASGVPLPDGEVGMLEVRGPNVFAGYWRDPERSAADLREDGFFVTGDLGVRSPDGYVTIVGRGKDLVITGGLNVYPREVEDALDALPGVRESAVVGLPHPDLGEGVTAVVVPEAGARVEEAAVIASLRDVLAGYKCPKRILVVDELPRNAMGKVQKAALRERYASLYAG